MRKQYPGVALSVKTHQATRSVLNHCRDTIKSLLGSGMLDENEAEKLFMVREGRGGREGGREREADKRRGGGP